MSETQTFGPWRVVGHRSDGEPVVVRDDSPEVRYRLLTLSGSGPPPALSPGFAHPGVVARVDVQREYWVLDDAAAVSARDLFERAEAEERLDLEIAAAIAWPVLRTLRDLHRARREPLRHVNLTEIMIDRDGGVRLHAELPLDRDRRSDGAEAYSPELLRGAPAASITLASDVYAVGCVMFRILAGRWPHAGDEQGGSITNVLTGRVPKPLGALCPDLPIELERAIERAIAADSAARHRDAGELLDALQPWLPDEAVAREALVELARRYEPTAPGRMLTAPAPPLTVPAPPPPPPPVAPRADDDVLALPRALEPWREALQMFPQDLALGVGHAVRRIARLIGPLRLDADMRRGVPDGYRGVERRGPLERLLLSEWAILLELPDEFVRRAAMGEQLFTALAHKEPGGVRRSVVLFDGGPRSLGRPRIVQLAVLIALATRAREAGVRFAWGVVQDDRRSQIAELNPASIRRLLEGRSLVEATPVDGAEWAIALGEPQAADDLWLVGPAGIEEVVALGGGTRVVVEDSPDPAQRVVDVTLTRARAAPRKIALELPAEPDCVRLIREPFKRRARVQARAGSSGPIAAMWFDPSGRRLIEQHADGAISATHVQRTPRETVLSVVHRSVPAGEQILGATFSHNRLFTAETDNGALVVRRLGNQGGVGQDWPFLVPPEAFVALFVGEGATMVIDTKGKALTRVYLLDRRGDLWLGELGKPLGILHRNVSGLLKVESRVLYAHRAGEDAVRVTRVIDGAAQVVAQWPLRGEGSMVWCAGAAVVPGEGVAVRVDDGTWVYAGGSQPVTLRAPLEAKVVGAAFINGEFGLLHLAVGGRSLAWVSAQGQRTLVTMPRPIARVALNPRTPTVACADEAGLVRVVDTDGHVLSERAR